MENSQEYSRKRTMIALCYLGAHGATVYGLYKLYKTEEAFPDFESLTVDYDLEPVESGKWDIAISWTATYARWHSFGVWWNGEPGMIWAGLPVFEPGNPRPTDVQRAFLVLSDKGAMPWVHEWGWELVPCGVRFDLTKTTGPYRWLRSTRAREELFRLRRTYPNAPELSFIPSLVLDRLCKATRWVPDWAKAARL